MGLYLCVFANDRDDDDLDGVEVGGYDDFHALRQVVCTHLERDAWGSRFPYLMNHEDSTGEWTPDECLSLISELRTIQQELSDQAPGEYQGWQADVAKQLGLRPATLAATFIDVDGEPLLDRLRELAELAVDQARPITFM